MSLLELYNNEIIDNAILKKITNPTDGLKEPGNGQAGIIVYKSTWAGQQCKYIVEAVSNTTIAGFVPEAEDYAYGSICYCTDGMLRKVGYKKWIVDTFGTQPTKPDYYNNLICLTNNNTTTGSILPYTAQGITWDEINGALHTEGTTTGANYQIVTLSIAYNFNNQVMVPDHKYLTNIELTCVGMSQQTVARDANYMIVKPGNRSNWFSKGSYVREIFYESKNTKINKDRIIPFCIDLTDIYGYDNEPTTIAGCSNVIMYMNSHPGLVESSWKQHGIHWANGLNVNPSTGAFTGNTSYALSPAIKINTGATQMTITYTNPANQSLLVRYFNGSTFIKSVTINTTGTTTIDVPSNATCFYFNWHVTSPAAITPADISAGTLTYEQI